MRIQISELNYNKAMELDKRIFNISITGELVSDGVKLIDEDLNGASGLVSIFTLGRDYQLRVISIKSAYYVATLISDGDNPVVIKAGKIKEEEK